jgi:hypothetical protein
MDLVFEFGHSRIVPYRRELLADGQPIPLGGRTFDVLMAFIEQCGAKVGHRSAKRRKQHPSGGDAAGDLGDNVSRHAAAWRHSRCREADWDGRD